MAYHQNQEIPIATASPSPPYRRPGGASLAYLQTTFTDMNLPNPPPSPIAIHLTPLRKDVPAGRLYVINIIINIIQNIIN